MVCTGCGAEANASCNCGKPYVPKAARAEKYAKENPSASVREIAEKADVSHGTAQRAKARVSDGTPVNGRDGKEYPATKIVIVSNDEDQRTKIKSLSREPYQFTQRFAGSLNDWFETCPKASAEALIYLATSLHLCAEEYERMATLVEEKANG